jgi:hypothetical protein
MTGMGEPISIRPDGDAGTEPDAPTVTRGGGPGAPLRDGAARDAQRARIRPASEAIGHRVANSSEAQAFYKEIGTPTTDAG